MKKYILGKNILLAFTSTILVAGCAQKETTEAPQDTQDQKYEGVMGKTLADSKEWWPEKKRAPKDAPNVIYFLIDDAGYGTASAFGGLMETPTLDSLANNGLRYTNFHSTSICSPTRAALLTGRNSHSVHMGLFPVTATGFPGYDGRLPQDKATIAEILHENSYNTYAVGKYHLTPINEITAVGPFDRWPTGKGFDHFYGWHLGHTDQYHPNLYEDNNVIDIEPNTTHVTTLLADKAIKYIANQRSLAPENPFFLYFATGAIHSPHQVDKKWSDLYKGKFDKGWDWYREEVLARQKKLGVVPANAVLPPRNPKVPAWDSLSADERKVYARYMEIYAGFMTHADYEFGRIVNYLKEIGELDNTVIIAIIGDNGSSPSSKHGSLNSYISGLESDQQVKEALKNIDKFGTEESSSDAPFGWTQATNTPFRLWKADPNSEGGTHNPLIVFYPKGIKEKGGIRNQYGHVNDIAPTTVELIGATVPETIKGVKQKPFEGTSLFYSFNDAQAPSRHAVQYYEIKGKRAIYKDGWKASVYHQPDTDFSKDVWELHNLNEDFNERVDLAAKNPEKLKELQDLFDAEAKKYNIYPLQDATPSGGRALSAFGLKDKIVLYPGVDQLLNYSGPQFKATSFTITAEVDYKKGDQGVLFATGSAFDGLSLFVKDGKFQVAHNTGTIIRSLESPALKEGKLNLKVELNYVAPAKEAGEKEIKGNTPAGTEVIYINDVKAGERPIVYAEAKYIASYKDGVDVGADLNSPVSDKYKVPFRYRGKFEDVIIEYKK
ncbi:MAG TPA: arylsulfatase [Cytophagaceae bacterium]|nr:arylsulfatase [Cytophagaceae bacterium]